MIGSKFCYAKLAAFVSSVKSKVGGHMIYIPCCQLGKYTNFRYAHAIYHICHTVLPSRTVALGFWMHIQENPTVSEQGRKVAIAANRIVEVINITSRTFSYWPRLLIVTLYKSLVRPHLDW